MHVTATIGQTLRDDDLSMGVHGHLPVVALQEYLPALHDSAIGVSQISLSFLSRDSCRLWLMAGLVRVRASLDFCLGLGFQFRLCLLDSLQTFLFIADPFGQFITSLVGPIQLILFPINSLGFGKPSFHFCL